MSKKQIPMFIGNRAMTVVDAMEKIDKNARGILFIVNEGGVLLGSITDGDIRRWLIKTGDLNGSVLEAMHTDPKYVFEEEVFKADKIMKSELISVLPVLKKDKSVADILFSTDSMECNAPETDKSLSGIPVVIMAGGMGTRLYPYTKILPKPLIPIGEIPIVERVLNCFVKYGIKEYYMTVNYKKSMIKSYFEEVNPEYNIRYVEEDEPLGTGGSIKLIKTRFEKPLFVVNCDALVFADYFDIYQYHIKVGNDITIVSSLKNITIPYGVLHSKEDGQLTEIEEKPKLSYFINTGMYVINPSVIDKIPGNTVFHMTDLVDSVMRDRGKVGMYPISEDSFLDMGEFGEMHRMEEKLNIVSD
ncbi:sugar phosphate nucleotidyltransferase [Roseburia sp. 1XD42-69]|uniref:sugar phosphate nucleotidyltransferase n=1 Tax=Roseburia sp. 1XD42-69 TaxID=2320088 RepID=UPI000EA285BD|nr:sugar phosphate nucleotidyltransferase [Roseburia sp. 1XD42-69]RKJ66348.1 CBS domain-containing protein [Roseburia sp. 1XD42-69]